MPHSDDRINRLLTYYKTTDNVPDIVRWRQQIENEEAGFAHRPPHTINDEQAVQDFCRALVAATEHSESAKVFHRELNRLAEKENIDRQLAYLLDQGHENKILEWRQLIEWRENPALQGTHRTRYVSPRKALADFRRALLHKKAKHSASAQDLLRRLLPKQTHERFLEPLEDADLSLGALFAWREDGQAVKGEGLTAGQKSIIEQLTKLRADHQSDTVNGKNNNASVTDYEKAIRKAIRLGLQDHHFCVEWIRQRQAFGDRAALHALHRTHPHLERGVKRPIRGEEKALLKRICELGDKGKSLRSIHAYLKRQGKYSHSWAAFQKWCADPIRTAIIEPLSD